jgi:hypothetical protein
VSLAAFDEAMGIAIEAAQVGFHFEEGGCWGMARALQDRFAQAGLQARIRYKPTGFVHCWVESHGVAFDYRGVMPKQPPFGLTIDDERFAGIAAHFGVDLDTLHADVALARPIVDAAFDMAPLRLEDEDPATC